MITLTILHADGTTYWTGQFNDHSTAQSWLSLMQTQPSWQSGDSFTLVDNTPPITLEMLLIQAKATRNGLLTACDWTQMADSPLSADKKAAWATYRQALRDLPDQAGFDPANPTWPVQP